MALLSDGWSMNAVSLHLHVSRSALREWRDHGVQPRGRATPCFRCEGTSPGDAAAYAALLGYYLGDGCVSRQRRTYSLRVSCDRGYPHIVSDVTAVVKAVHRGGRVCQVAAPGVVVVQNCWNHWPCVLPQHGPGRKHERSLTLEHWQRELVEAEPAAFLRGLFHSDGSRVNNWTSRLVAGERKRFDYPRWQFVNNSEDIRRFCAEALDLVGIAWKQSSWKTISVSTRAGVARLDELIGLKR
ncbi:MAG TPA: LAGLIDADG family homing endonuclease [Nocardioidaceae bacterium]